MDTPSAAFSTIIIHNLETHVTRGLKGQSHNITSHPHAAHRPTPSTQTGAQAAPLADASQDAILKWLITSGA